MTLTAVPDLEDPAPDPRLAHRCRCGSARRDHAGRTGGGVCLGHPVLTPPRSARGEAALGPCDDGRMGWDEALALDTWSEDRVPCPGRCARFRHDPEDRMLRRAVEAAADEPWVALARYGRRRTARRTADKAASGGGYSVGPSDHSSCHHAIQLRERPPEGMELVPVSKAAADVGTMIHEEYTRARRAAYPWRRFKVRVRVPGLDRPGEADEVDPVIGRVTDYKSAGDWKWDRVGEDGPPETEWKQVATYAYGIAHDPDTAVDGFAPVDLEIVYVHRETGRTERFLRPYSEAHARAAVLELVGLLDALEEGRELPRVRGGIELLGPTVDGICRAHCPFVKECWRLDEVPANRNPEGWLLARDDEDGAITATLRVYDANRTTASEAGKQKDYARVLLEGVEPGRYGDLMLRWQGGRLLDPVPDKDARLGVVEAELTLAAAEGRPPRVDLPWPTRQKRSAVTIRVSKVRAADLERERREAPS